MTLRELLIASAKESSLLRFSPIEIVIVLGGFLFALPAMPRDLHWTWFMLAGFGFALGGWGIAASIRYFTKNELENTQ